VLPTIILYLSKFKIMNPAQKWMGKEFSLKEFACGSASAKWLQ
jgi:hypothetical protein